MRRRNDSEEMGRAIKELVEEAQRQKPEGSHLHVVRKDERNLAWKLGFAVGTAAYWISRIFIRPITIAGCVTTLLYLLMRLAGISVEIIRAGEVLLRIK